MTALSIGPRLVSSCAVASLLLLSASASAQGPSANAAPRTPPYSLPWLLRPALPLTVVRLDETMAFYEDPASRISGASYLTSLIVTYKANPRWVPIFREIFVSNSSPSGGKNASGHGFSNPLLGVTYFHPVGNGWRWTGFFASAIPIGSGGGAEPDKGASAAVTAGLSARSQMDNALFATNYWTLIGGLDLARITPGLTLQAEMTVLQLTRARGPSSQDASRTNLTAGLHAGHCFSPRICLGAEIRLQRWLTDAAPVRNDPAGRSQLTLGIGPRLHFKIAGKRWLRPGVSYSRASDDPMAKKGYDIVQLDAPFAF